MKCEEDDSPLSERDKKEQETHMPSVAIYCKENELRTAIDVLNVTVAMMLRQAELLENGSLKLEQGEEIQYHLRDQARGYLAAAHELTWALNNVSAQPTPDEEREAIKAVVDKALGEGRYHLNGNLAERVQGIIQDEQSKRSEAFGLVATLADEMRTKFEAMQWVLKSAVSGGTHREKNRWIELAQTACTEIQAELQRIDPDTLSRYTTWDWKTGSWNIRKLQSDVYHKESQIRRLQERIAELEQGTPAATDEDGGSPPF